MSDNDDNPGRCRAGFRRGDLGMALQLSRRFAAQIVRIGCLAVGAVLVVPNLADAVELSFWTNLTTAAQANVIQKQIAECTAKQPGLTVKFETVPFGSMYTRLITALRKKDAPNIMNTLEGAVAFMQAKGGLEPVSDLVDELGRADFIASYL